MTWSPRSLRPGSPSAARPGPTTGRRKQRWRTGNVSVTSEQLLATELVRLVTAGSVDDGKSTLIGRLLYDTKQILADQLEHIEETSKRRGDGYVNLALLTDGLRAEREQGITIDVAYRSFVTPRRRFQLADAPGHVQYTRNMVTGASTADVAIILVDARKGVIEQTRRHSYLAAILGIPHVVVAVNKMDLAGFSRDRFREIEKELRETSDRLGLRDVRVIPMSALRGDNVVERGEGMPWYDGPTLLEHLETVEIAGDRDLDHRRFPVQWVIRPISEEHHDFRGYAGQVAGGVWREGDDVVVLPSGRRTSVASVETSEGPLELAVPGMSVTLRLADDLDVSRGDMLADPEQPPTVAREVEATVCWMAEKPLEPRTKLAIKHTTRTVRAVVDELVSVVDIHTLEDQPAPERLELNEIARVRLRLSEPLSVDPYAENRATGAFILIDEATNDTVAAGMILSASN
ncbi:MAG: 50S ribosome-binding GTPase [Actinobacteria bacterium]|nr:50S ribosome-binding GTPase [Actinomycetota bacterium]